MSRAKRTLPLCAVLGLGLFEGPTRPSEGSLEKASLASFLGGKFAFLNLW